MLAILPLILLNLFLLSISLIPNWNLKASSKDLLVSSSNINTYNYIVTHRLMYRLVAS